MDNIIFASIGFLILLSIVYFIPLGISMKGKATLVIAAFVVSLIGLLSLPLFQWWYILILLITLSGLLTILLQRAVKTSETFQEDYNEEVNNHLLSKEQKDTLQSLDDIEEEQPDIDKGSFHHDNVIMDYEDIQETHDYVHESYETIPEKKFDQVDEQNSYTEPEAVTDLEEVSQNRQKESGREASNMDSDQERVEPNPIVELSPEEELLAARQQTQEQPKQDRELNSETSSLFSDDQEDFVIDEFKEEELEKKDLKQHFEEREGFESFGIDIIEEREVQLQGSDVLKEDRSEFTDLEDLLNQRDDEHGQKDS
ncbi:phage holin family protein [Pontibacillus marinus]|uniref:Uncharacterized protein n=1 Tax=Pontibacillus marinus BH030004 = DSM 16465 TaxID=1385511 RepID=A0A0A5HWT4_9BACI|nr:phage holin family protein [Pontibacillus marinus]KGX88082.1 hypothetical protein N783_08840 [Pontibacillus marinus BH030004 = DSM 16465]